MSNNQNENIEISAGKLATAALVLLLGGNAGNIYTLSNPADTFSDLDGAKLEARLLDQIHDHELKIQSLKIQLDECKGAH